MIQPTGNYMDKYVKTQNYIYVYIILCFMLRVSLCGPNAVVNATAASHLLKSRHHGEVRSRRSPFGIAVSPSPLSRAFARRTEKKSKSPPMSSSSSKPLATVFFHRSDAGLLPLLLRDVNCPFSTFRTDVSSSLLRSVHANLKSITGWTCNFTYVKYIFSY